MQNFLKLLTTIIFTFVLTSSLSACSGNCDYPTDRAKDGSICGDRAASVRPGGRNPDTDWIWLIVVGGAIAWFVSSNNKKDKNNRPHTPKHGDNRTSSNRRPKPIPSPVNKKPKSNVNTPREQDSVKGNQNKKPETEIDISKVKRILQLDFNYVSPPYLKVSLEAVCQQTGEMGGTNFDAAARLILVEIGSYEGMNTDNIKWFVDAQTQNLFKYRNRMTIGTVGLVHALNMFRAFRELPDL